MNHHCRYLFVFLFSALSLVAAGSGPADPPPVYLTQWGSFGTGNGDLSQPQGVAVDGAGNIYVADTGNHRIQKFGGPWLDVFVGEPESPGDR